MTADMTDVTPAGARALDFIGRALADGRTIHVATMTRITAVTPKTARRWAESGHDLFRLSTGGDLLMASGRSYVRLTAGAIVLVGITAV